MRNLLDYHIHSNYSFDSSQSIESAIIAAINAGMKEICFTEHVSMDFEDKSYNTFHFYSYENEIKNMSYKYRNKISIKIGIEAGECYLYPKEFKKYYENDLDFIIGSVHNINKKGLRTNLREQGEVETYETYFSEVLKLCKNSQFDVLGHLDLPQRYAYDNFGIYDFSLFKQYIFEILKILIKNNKGIELNTSGLSRNLLFPRIEILKMYKELNGTIITTGSDAHDSKRVGENMKYANELLKDIGFKYIFTFEKRTPSGISL